MRQPWAVALIGTKVYGDLNVAVKAGGNVVLVANGAITEAITVAENSTLVLNKGAYAISGLGNLTLKGGTYDFNPETAGCVIPTGYEVQDNGNNTWTVIRGHEHSWTMNWSGNVFKAECSDPNKCPANKGIMTVTLAAPSRDYNAATYSSAEKSLPSGFTEDQFTAETGVSIGAIKYYNKNGEEISAPKYTGDYTAKVVVGSKEIVQSFSITKPSGGYTDGWEVGNTSSSVRYDTWGEAEAAAQDGDTIYYRDGNMDSTEHNYSVDKAITIDFGNAVLKQTKKSDFWGTADTMTIKNTGAGTLTIQNVEIQQPRVSFSGHVATVGNIVFGTGVKTTNNATDSDNYLKITVSDGALIVTAGQYQNSFAGSYKLRGGQYKSTYGEPTADTAAGYIVRTISGDYDRDIVYHEHLYAYSAEGNVISATCDAQDHEFCGFGTKTATLNAPNKEEDGEAYGLASIAYSDGFPEQTGVITYWNGGEEISAPTTFGSYTAKTTIGGATAVKAFEIIHHHNFVYDKDDATGTITARCTTTDDCDFNVNKRIATLTAQNGTYTGFWQDLATAATNTSDFPTNVVLSYSCEGKPTVVGDYTATMTVADTVTVTKDFSIAKASMGDVAASMTSASLNFTGAEQQNTLGSATLGSYNLQSGDYELSGVTKATGSGYSNETYQVTLTAKGDNFTGSKTIEWTIKAPTRDFNKISIAGDYAGTLSGTTVTMTGADWKYCAAGTAPDGNPNAGWYTCLQLDWPQGSGTTLFTRPESALHTLSTNPGEQFWGSDLPEDGGVITVQAGKLVKEYMKYSWWHVRLTPEIAEACEDETFTRSMTACGLKWSDSIYGDAEGVREVTCTVMQPMTETVVLTVPTSATTYDLGATKLAKSALKLEKNVIVTTSVKQDDGKIFTEEDGYQVYCIEKDEGYQYVCFLATHYVTVPDVEHATKVVKVGDTVKEPTEAGGKAYAVFHGDTVTVAYTPATGYETADGTKTIANVTADTTLTDLPTVTATSYAITYVLDGGENDPANPSSYTIESETITLADPTKTDYTFAGWTPEGVIAKGSTGDKTFTATWKLAAVAFTVAAPANASVTQVATNGVALVAPYAVVPGTAVTVSYTAAAGYLFANGTNTMDAEITVSEAGEQPAPQGTETTAGKAKIGTTYYLTLADAITAYDGTDTIGLCADGAVSGEIAKVVNLDLAGHGLAVATTDAKANITITNSLTTGGVQLAAGGTLTVYAGATVDLSALAENTAGGEGSVYVQDGATLKYPKSSAKLSPGWLCHVYPNMVGGAKGATIVTDKAYVKVLDGTADGQEFWQAADDAAYTLVTTKSHEPAFDYLEGRPTLAEILAWRKDTNTVVTLLKDCAEVIELAADSRLVLATNGFAFADSQVTAGEGQKVTVTVDEGVRTYVSAKSGPTVVDPIGGDEETNPTIKAVEGTNGVYVIEVKTNVTTTVKVEGLQTTDKVVVPEQIDTVVGVASNQVVIVGEATNEVGAVVKVDITKAFRIAENDAGVKITLNDDPKVVVKVVIGEKEEDIKVTPELGKSEGTVVAEQPFVVAEEKVAMGVKTIPGLTYRLLSGDTVSAITTVVREIVAKDTRVVLEAAKASDPSKFYKIEVVK